MSGVPSGAAMEASRPISRQAGFGTLKLPECTSRRAVSSVSSSDRMPRAPKATVGRPLACLGPSVTSDDVGREQVAVLLGEGAEEGCCRSPPRRRR